MPESKEGASDPCLENFPGDPLGWTYNLDSPRPYFRALSSLYYRQPQVVADFILRNSTSIMSARQKDRLYVLDFACGYGAVGALLKFDIKLDELYAYYEKDIEEEDGNDALKKDNAYFANLAKVDVPIIISGLDIADKAVAYAVECGFLDAGFTDDLTKVRMCDDLADFAVSVDLIVEAGAVYSVAQECYERLLDGACGNKPWLLFGPRGDVDARPLWSWLQEIGYKIEACGHKSEPYRRILDEEERKDVEKRLRQLGRQPND